MLNEWENGLCACCTHACCGRDCGLWGWACIFPCCVYGMNLATMEEMGIKSSLSLLGPHGIVPAILHGLGFMGLGSSTTIGPATAVAGAAAATTYNPLGLLGSPDSLSPLIA